MSHSQLMLKGRLSLSLVWPLALTISLSTCVWPFWQRESSLSFPICVKRAFTQVLTTAKLSGRMIFVQRKQNCETENEQCTTCTTTARRQEVSKYYWLAENRLGSRQQGDIGYCRHAKSTEKIIICRGRRLISFGLD